MLTLVRKFGDFVMLGLVGVVVITNLMWATHSWQEKRKFTRELAVANATAEAERKRGEVCIANVGVLDNAIKSQNTAIDEAGKKYVDLLRLAELAAADSVNQRARIYTLIRAMPRAVAGPSTPELCAAADAHMVKFGVDQ